MKSFFSPFCIRESKGTDCTSLTRSISAAFVSNVTQSAESDRKERKHTFSVVIPVHVILGKRCSVTEVYVT